MTMASTPHPNNGVNDATAKKRGRDADVTGTVNKAWIKTPLFLTKTFEMINDCDPDVATWTEKGDMFVVKDPSKLQTAYIPRYFGHSNFSSFTRQLNFYGFRKVFPESLLRKVNGQGGLGPGVSDNSDKHVSFFHESFRKGHPELLQQIRRSSTKKPKPASTAAQESEVEDLKRKVATLEDRLSILSSEMNTKIAKITSDFDVKIAKMKLMVKNSNATDDSSRMTTSSLSVSRGVSERKTSFLTKTSIKEEKPLPPATVGSFVDRLNLSPADDGIEPMTAPPPPAPKIGRLTTEEFFNGIFEENRNANGDVTAGAHLDDNDRICSTLLMLASQNSSSSKRR